MCGAATKQRRGCHFGGAGHDYEIGLITEKGQKQALEPSHGQPDLDRIVHCGRALTTSGSRTRMAQCGGIGGPPSWTKWVLCARSATVGQTLGGTLHFGSAQRSGGGQGGRHADHDTLLNDVNDCPLSSRSCRRYRRDLRHHGPGTIVAVDSGSQTQESFRGLTRNSFEGSLRHRSGKRRWNYHSDAKATGLTDGTATITATEGTWVPCSGTCD